MLEGFFSHFKGSEFSLISSTFESLSPILHSLEQHYTEDKQDAKNAMIDTLVQILLSHKD